MDGWGELDRELALWHAAGEVPSFWWRDDDTEKPTQALDRLLALAGRFRVPLHLAVVPKGAGRELAARLNRETDVWLIQHGFAHVNHEPAGARASEVGENRDITLISQDLRAGWAHLSALELPRLLPGFAPPWNRLSAATLTALPGLGYRVVSAFDALLPAPPPPGLAAISIHADPIRWKDGPNFRGTDKTLDLFTTHLRERRLGLADKDRPTGLSTHHLQTGDQVWDFLDELLARIGRPQAGEWVRLTTFL